MEAEAAAQGLGAVRVEQFVRGLPLRGVVADDRRAARYQGIPGSFALDDDLVEGRAEIRHGAHVDDAAVHLVGRLLGEPGRAGDVERAPVGEGEICEVHVPKYHIAL